MHPTEEVWCAKRTDEPLEEDDIRPAGAVGRRNMVGTVLLLHVEEHFGDPVEGFVPTDPLPLVLAPCTGSLERILQSIGVIQEFRRSAALGTDVPEGSGTVLVARDPHHHTVTQMDIYSTHSVTAAAD